MDGREGGSSTSFGSFWISGSDGKGRGMGFVSENAGEEFDQPFGVDNHPTKSAEDLIGKVDENSPLVEQFGGFEELGIGEGNGLCEFFVFVPSDDFVAHKFALNHTIHQMIVAFGDAHDDVGAFVQGKFDRGVDEMIE